MFPPIWFQVLQLLVTLIYSCSFDRHALDLLEKMLTLDPSQVCYIHIVVKFAKKMLPLYSFVFFLYCLLSALIIWINFSCLSISHMF
jgi:hypothetical protein